MDGSIRRSSLEHLNTSVTRKDEHLYAISLVTEADFTARENFNRFHTGLNVNTLGGYSIDDYG
jgi:hypothetical protein